MTPDPTTTPAGAKRYTEFNPSEAGGPADLMAPSRIRWPHKQPVISFTFDDFPRSAATVGSAILRGNNLSGTYYAALGYDHWPERFTEADLRRLAAEGHELACHTYSHSNAETMTVSAIENDIRQNRSEMRKILPDIELVDFSFPYGCVTDEVRACLSRLFLSCRGIAPGLVEGEFDRSHLPANQLYTCLNNLSAVQDLIERNREIRGWLVFYTHDVDPDPSQWGSTPEYLEEVVNRSIASGASIMTIRQALEECGLSHLERSIPS